MKVSVHAGERFLERVMMKKKYTVIDVDFAMNFLANIFKDIVPNAVNKHIVIPGFEKYKAVYCQNTIVTIIPKGSKHV
ncbi:MAG: hypothetical protein Q9M43_07060 [Sulfurimonas sp.]|nr:hypothetical protein [Sulfurimonas sp.]